MTRDEGIGEDGKALGRQRAVNCRRRAEATSSMGGSGMRSSNGVRDLEVATA